ncbi:hypothetical protein A6M21_16490 [Desulfotomaculum copahuensis]|uniref:Uncharacterized protein n=1 Tax=Desulfotomaculum copahuensis TaxID=1838280 RepID=A0A1B7LK01_9FIRM|nr:hypothetical protein A6M21_16490 [Desulfotomaculum copahuensis]
MFVTERDRKTLEFIAKWRFVTTEQLQKAGIFKTARKKAYNRVLALRQVNLIKAGRLESGQLYYYLAPRGGEIIGIDDPWYAKRYRDAGGDVVLKHLVACDFALALGIEYLPHQEVLNRLMAASYDVLAKCVRGNDLFYENGGLLHTLIIDYQYSLKYLSERIKLYSRLPPGVRNQLVVDFLVFDETRQKQILRAARETGLKIKALKANWKY